MLRLVGASIVCVVSLAGCGDAGAPGSAPVEPPQGRPASGLRLEPAPRWIGRYCRKAADDLRHAVLCPRKLPPPVHVSPCRGPAPEEELWGRHCSVYVLDVLFEGPPGYRGPFSGRTGHLALWSVASRGPTDGRPFACPAGARREGAARLSGRYGSWWACPAAGADLNSGHIAFHWRQDRALHGISTHGATDVDREIVRAVVDELELVSPAAPSDRSLRESGSSAGRAST